MNITLGKEFERRISEEVNKGFKQLAAGEISNCGVMDIFEQVSKESNGKV